MRVEKFHPDHLKIMVTKTEWSPAQAKSLADSPHSYTLFDNFGPVLCGGVCEYWEGRGEAWAILAHRHFSAFMLVRAALRYLEWVPVTRVEAAIDSSFKPGKRLVRALGFTQEASRLRKFLPGGKDADLYSRVKG